MTDLSTLARDPEWLPHRIDPAAGTLQFLHIPRGDLSGPQFLAERTPATPADEAFLPLDALDALGAEQPDPGPLHFIFHTAFCRSTLLVRALDIPGLATGLSEPGILVSLTNMGDAGRPLVKPMLDLLARRHGSGDGEGEAAVVVKPTNHANRLIPALLEACPDAKAVLMTNPLSAFLAAVVRKGMMGRRWGRQLYLETMGYAGMDLGMDAREQFAMTDLQAAGLAWFLNQRYFAGLAQAYGERVRVLDGDRFDAARAETLAAFGAFTGIGIDAARAQAIADDPVFARDAKTGGDFADKSARDAAASQSAVVEDEIAKVGEWIGLIARQGGLEAPLRQTLF